MSRIVFLGCSGSRMVHTHHLHSKIERQRQPRALNSMAWSTGTTLWWVKEAPGSYQEPEEGDQEAALHAGVGNRGWEQPGNKHQHIALLDAFSRRQILHGGFLVFPGSSSSPSSEVSLLTVVGGVAVGLLAVILTAVRDDAPGQEGCQGGGAKDPGSREPMVPWWATTARASSEVWWLQGNPAFSSSAQEKTIGNPVLLSTAEWGLLWQSCSEDLTVLVSVDSHSVCVQASEDTFQTVSHIFPLAQKASSIYPHVHTQPW